MFTKCTTQFKCLFKNCLDDIADICLRLNISYACTVSSVFCSIQYHNDCCFNRRLAVPIGRRQKPLRHIILLICSMYSLIIVIVVILLANLENFHWNKSKDWRGTLSRKLLVNFLQFSIYFIVLMYENCFYLLLFCLNEHTGL